MYRCWYDYVKPKYGQKARLHYMDKDTFIVYIKTDDFYKGIKEDIKTRFDFLIWYKLWMRKVITKMKKIKK